MTRRRHRLMFEWSSDPDDTSRPTPEQVAEIMRLDLRGMTDPESDVFVHFVDDAEARP